MILIPLGVLLAGYGLVWFGAVTLRGDGIGLLDLFQPSQIGKVDGLLPSLSNGGKGNSATSEAIGNAFETGASNIAGDQASKALGTLPQPDKNITRQGKPS